MLGQTVQEVLSGSRVGWMETEESYDAGGVPSRQEIAQTEALPHTRWINDEAMILVPVLRTISKQV